MQLSAFRSALVRLNRDTRIGAALALIVFGTIFLVLGTFTVRDELRFFREGVSAEARVLQKWQAWRPVQHERPMCSLFAHGAGRRHPRYRVRYEYEDLMKQTHQGEATLSQAVWEQQRLGGILHIQYLRSTPQISRLAPAFHVGLWVSISMQIAGSLLLLTSVKLLWQAAAGARLPASSSGPI